MLYLKETGSNDFTNYDMKRLKNLLLTGILAVLASGCLEDDVFEIFASGQTWHWSSSYDTSDWEDDNKGTSTLSYTEISQVNGNQDAYIIIFSDDGTVEGRGSSFSFTGKWSADGSDHSFSVTLTASGTPSGLDKTFYEEIGNAKFYRGNSTLLKLFNEDKNHFIQFYPKTD